MADADADAEFIADESTLVLARRRRRFTLEQANRTLPLIRRITADIVATHAEARRLHAKLDFRSGRAGATAEDRAARRDVEFDLDRVVQRLQYLVDELAEVGVELTDYRTGAVDFVARHGGRTIRLSWRPGEAAITHWHELDDDAGTRRQPLAALRPTE